MLANPQSKKIDTKKGMHKKAIVERVRPRLKEVFDKVDRNGSSAIEILEFKEALNLLNLDISTENAENFFEEVAQNSKELPKNEISFEEFVEIYVKIIEYYAIPVNLMASPSFDFMDPFNFVMVFDNKPIAKTIFQDLCDESVYIRQKIEAKYSLKYDENIKILSEFEKNYSANNCEFNPFQSSKDTWIWIKKCVESRKASNDPTIGIHSMIVISKKSAFRDNMIQPKIEKGPFDYNYYESSERKSVLSYFGWSFIYPFTKTTNPQLDITCKNLEADHQYHRSSAIAVFHFDFNRALQSLDLYQEPTNETMIIKPIINALKNFCHVIGQDTELQSFFIHEYNTKNIDDENMVNNLNSAGGVGAGGSIGSNTTEKAWKIDLLNTEMNVNYGNDTPTIKPKYVAKAEEILKDIKFLKTLCGNLKLKDPYLNAIASFIANNKADYIPQVLKNSKMTIFDRLAFACLYLSKEQLEKYILDEINRAKQKGLLEGIIITGKSHDTLDIMQSYVDRTGDVQTVALLGIYLRLLKFPGEKKYQEWMNIYRDMMNKFQYWEARIRLDKEILELEKAMLDTRERRGAESILEQTNYAASQRCYFCTASLAHPTLMSNLGPTKKGYAQLMRFEKTRLNCCPDCVKPLSNCAICLLPVGIHNTYIEIQNKHKYAYGSAKKEIEPINLDAALVWCQYCKHGGHLAHIDEWFREHTSCSVSGCGCECFLNDF